MVPVEAADARKEDPTGVRVRGGMEAGTLLTVDMVFTPLLDPGADP